MSRCRPLALALVTAALFSGTARGAPACVTELLGLSETELRLKEPIELLECVHEAVGQLKAYTMVLRKQELIGAEQVCQVSFAKVRKPSPPRSPRDLPDIYLLVMDGEHKGRQAIYRSDLGQELRAKVWYWRWVSRDRRGGDAMEGQHHTITDLGLDFVVDLVLVNVRKGQTAGVEPEYDGVESLHGRRVHRVSASAPPVVHLLHTVKKGESLWSIAELYGQDMYVIQRTNSRNGAHDIEEGDSIKVPEYYATRFILWIYSDNGLPAKLEVYDNEQLYERYDYTHLTTDAVLGDREFKEKTAKRNIPEKSTLSDVLCSAQN